MRTLLVVGMLLLLILPAAAAQVVAPPVTASAAPATVSQTIAPLQPALSTFVIPISASIAPLVPLIESQVPVMFTKTDSFELDPQQRFGIKYDVSRGPIALTTAGLGVHASTTVLYALEGCHRTLNPISKQYTMWPCVSCGFGEAKREAYIAIDSHFTWDANWRMKSQTTARPVQFPRACGVTMFNVDVSARYIGPLVDQQLREAVKSIDRNTPRMTNVRPNAQQIWTALQTPSALAPNVWLVLEPADLSITPIQGNGLTVTSTLTVLARTRVVVGAKPAAIVKPLPPLRVAAPPAGGIRVPFDLELAYDEASRRLGSELAGKTYDAGGKPLLLRSLKLSPGSSGKLRIDADISYRGGILRNYNGVVTLEGIPRFDAATQTLSITALDYVIDRRGSNVFFRAAERLAHETLRNHIASQANFSMREPIANIRGEIDRSLTRPLSAGVKLRGKIDAMQPTGISIQPNAIDIQVLALGSAAIDVVDWK
jgi:hypothetical protein